MARPAALLCSPSAFQVFSTSPLSHHFYVQCCQDLDPSRLSGFFIPPYLRNLSIITTLPRRWFLLYFASPCMSSLKKRDPITLNAYWQEIRS